MAGMEDHIAIICAIAHKLKTKLRVGRTSQQATDPPLLHMPKLLQVFLPRKKTTQKALFLQAKLDGRA